MSILNDLLNRVTDVLNGLQGGEIPRLAVLQSEGEILDSQKEQLAEGKASSGQDLRPYYSEDLRARGGWFLSPASAANYSAWKESIGNLYQAGERNPDAPNLYINGKFYSEIGVQFGSDSVGIIPKTAFALEVMSKYGMQSFGLTRERWNGIMWDNYDKIMDEMKRRLYA